MTSLSHLFPKGTGTTEQYIYPRDVRGGPTFNTPPRDRVPHSEDLISQINTIEAAEEPGSPPETIEQTKSSTGKVLEFSGDPGFDLKSDSLGFRPSKIELRSVRRDESGTMYATIFVPDGKMGFFVKRFEEYAIKVTFGKNPRPKNQDLVESISRIRLASLKSFWSDAGPFPVSDEGQLWWELWLSSVMDRNVGDNFRAEAEELGMVIAEDRLQFPERVVVLARGSINQLKTIPNLFEYLAEVRLAKLLSSELLELPASDQAEYIDEALERITFAGPKSPAVCHLDANQAKFFSVNQSDRVNHDVFCDFRHFHSSLEIAVSKIWQMSEKTVIYGLILRLSRKPRLIKV